MSNYMSVLQHLCCSSRMLLRAEEVWASLPTGTSIPVGLRIRGYQQRASTGAIPTWWWLILGSSQFNPQKHSKPNNQCFPHLPDLAHPSKIGLVFPNIPSCPLFEVLGKKSPSILLNSKYLFLEAKQQTIYCLQEGRLQDILPLSGLFQLQQCSKSRTKFIRHSQAKQKY